MSDQPTRTLPPDGDATADSPAAVVATRDGPPPTASLCDGFAGAGSARPLAPAGYQLLEEIGAGGMGTVYRARDLAFDRDVAVKILQSRYTANSAAEQRFLDEARITGQLQHPAIPPVHHIGTLPDGRPFLAMKLIKGDTLADRLATEPTCRGQYLAVFAQLCQAVAYAHSRQVIHRDLKPANIMVGSFGEVQLMDWGLAKVLTTSANEPTEAMEIQDNRTEVRTQRDGELVTHAGSVLGTPSFMAPARDVAMRLRGIADAGRIEESRLHDIADKARDEALRQQGIAEHARIEVEREREKLAVVEYGRIMQVAYQEWRNNDVVATMAILDSTRPDLRGWEWRYVHRLCHSELLTLKNRILVQSVSFSTDGSRIVTGGGLAAKLWDAKTGTELLILNGHTSGVDSVSFSADGLRIVTGSGDKTAKVWDAKTGTELLTLKGHTSGVSSVSFSTDGSRIVTGSHDNAAKVWEAKRGSDLLTLKGHTGKVVSVSFSADGSRIVTAGEDGTATTWDAKTGAKLLTLKGHTKRVSSASFNADGSRIVTGSWDKTAKVWDANTGTKLLTLIGHIGQVNSASFSADGTRIVTCGIDATAKVWDTRPFRDTRPPDPEPAPPPPGK